jgi:predicted O-methyltransferase YrrM
MMTQYQWAEVDSYLVGKLVPLDAVLTAALAGNAAAGLPPHDVSPAQGKFLNLLARMIGARRVLEIGTLGAYSTIWFARAVSEGGMVVTLEANPRHAAVAQANIRRAGLDGIIDLRVGAALDTLPLLVAEGRGPFDLIFIDADKPNNAAYLEWALKLSRTGTVLVADNVVRNGAVIDPESSDKSVNGVRAFIDMLAKEPRLTATALQTVGSKGWDGFVIAVVLAGGI